MVRKFILSFCFVLITLCSAIEVKNNDLVYPKFWNLYNGGFTTAENYPALKKSSQAAADWSATMKLNTFKVVRDYVGKTLYFITETSGDPVARLAPSFYVLKNKKEYLVWWSETPSSVKRKFFAFSANSSGQIIGSIAIPNPETVQYFAQDAVTQKVFTVSAKTAITPVDIKNGLCTDWQHDIPGAYDAFKGVSGSVGFQRFYLGAKPPKLLLRPGRDSWILKCSAREKEILQSEFDIPLQIENKALLAENEYFLSDNAALKIKEYYDANKEAFKTNSYYHKPNFLAHGDTCTGWQIKTGAAAAQCQEKAGRYEIANKKDPNAWVIISIDNISEDKVRKLSGPVRLSAQMSVRNITRGFYPWQTVFLDVIQKDAQGNIVGTPADVRLPLSTLYPDAKNFMGLFENEFIIAKEAVTVEVVLKIPGAPDIDTTKAGITFDNLTIDQVRLTKADGVFDSEKLFKSITQKPIELTTVDGQEYVVYSSAGQGLLIGDRSVTLKTDGQFPEITYDLKGSQDYNGFYSNIFSVTHIDTLEFAADFGGSLKQHGSPANWASNAIEIAYFDENGNSVYAAEYGSERYPKISFNPFVATQTLKSFFTIPHERGAKYAQVRLHVLRQTNNQTGSFDTNNYFTGTTYAKNIIIRPALNLSAQQSNSAVNGIFYDHINGDPLSWTVKNVKVQEDLSVQRRTVVFENTNDTWSSLKTELDIPDEATLLRGFLNVEAETIEAGLAQWEGFGFFLEADVVDQDGNTFRYSGIPAYQKINDSLVKLDRIPKAYRGRIEYYIPLYHEHLKIKKLYWQLALFGKGKVVLQPLAAGQNPLIVKIDLLNSGDAPNIPALWAQYGLYSADAQSFRFQKNYALAYKGQNYNYDSLETLQDHVSGFFKKEVPLTELLKDLAIGAQKEIQEMQIKAVPSYARVEREYNLEKDVKYVMVSFKVEGSAEAKYNFKGLLLDNAGNSYDVEVFKKQQNFWDVVSADKDVFSSFDQEQSFFIPVESIANLQKIRLIFGDNQGDVKFSNLKINFVSQAEIRNVHGKKEIKFGPFDARSVFEQKSIARLSAVAIKSKDQGALDSRDTVALEGASQVVPAVVIADYPSLKSVDTAIRNAVKNETLSFTKGSWKYDQEKPFSLVGMTIVGETFNTWFELRRKELTKKQIPYWAKQFSEKEQLKLLNGSEQEFILAFIRSQSLLWKKAGINTIRVHQLFSSWAGLDNAEISLVVDLLKSLQKEGFVIVFDMLPNTDFTSPFFKEISSKKYAADLTNTNDLFKAALVLPEVRDDYVKPAISKMTTLFQDKGFWPNSISYCNETGFTHGYWTLDKNNSGAHPYFSRVYSFYYERYLQVLPKYPRLISFMQTGQTYLQQHIQSVKIQLLLNDLTVMLDVVKSKRRIKDNVAYIYYNLLRDEVINSYPFYKEELVSFKKALQEMVEKPATAEYYSQLDKRMVNVARKLTTLQTAVTTKGAENSKQLESFLKDPGWSVQIAGIVNDVFKVAMPEKYTINAKTQLKYIDTFDPLSDELLKQSFYTSFILPVQFVENVNAFLTAQSRGKKYNVGLNNDFTRDVGALLGQAYLFVNNSRMEMRFNKYTHHPIGGHSMLLSPGFGNIFDEDSAIAYNLKLFTPPSGYPVQLSETNYTYAGDDNSGQGTWSIADYLNIVGGGNHLISFHAGPNNVDKPIINDYFNMGNRPYQVNALGMSAVAGLANSGGDYAKPTDIYYNRFAGMVEIKTNGLNALAGAVMKNKGVVGKKSGISFTYQGQRAKTNFLIVKQNIDAKTFFVHLFGLERNNRQKNRSGNPNLVESFGMPTIVYENIVGKVTIPCKVLKIESIQGITPQGKIAPVSSQAYTINNGELTIDTAKTDRQAISYKVLFTK